MDLTLSQDQVVLVETFSHFFAKECPTTRVRAAEPLGFDPRLWDQLVAMEAPAMGLPEGAGGSGASMLDLVLVGEQHGRSVAPVPFAEAVAALQLCHEAGLRDVIDRTIDGSVIPTLASRPARDGVATLVPAGAIADLIVVLDGDELVAWERHVDRSSAQAPANLGSSPISDVQLGSAWEQRTTLARGAEAQAMIGRAGDRYRLLMASLLLGLGTRAHEIGVDYAKARRAFGVTIGWFQTVSHRLAERCAELEGARLLVYEAAWAQDEGEANASELTAMAFLFASERSFATAAQSLQFHGGYGYTLEYDIQLYFRRAKAWPLAVGRPGDEYLRLADLAFG